MYIGTTFNLVWFKLITSLESLFPVILLRERVELHSSFFITPPLLFCLYYKAQLIVCQAKVNNFYANYIILSLFTNLYCSY